jgi:hypothetical protein
VVVSPLLQPPRRALVSTCASLGLLVLAACGAPPPADLNIDVVPEAATSQALDAEVAADLAEAFAIWEASRQERLIAAVDPFERFETLFGTGGAQYLADEGLYEVIFASGDEGFEIERDHMAGFGQGRIAGPELPARPRRVHDGERGGLDSSSCRSCHFSGGPDGAGTATQQALLRGDGRHLRSAVVRDAPHVMGLGYIQLVAEWFNLSLEAQAITHQLTAETMGVPILERLEVDGIAFGNVTFYPDGTRNTAGLVAISDDLVVRPFGHKGRHRNLVELTDEALQIHHGHQSVSREQTFADRPDAADWLGDGREGDRDNDGVSNEIVDAQAVILAAYMSMLGVPERRTPERVDLLYAWSRGSEVFDSVGCVACHRRELRMQIETTAHIGTGDSTLNVPVTPSEVGQDPKPARLDFGDIDQSGVPIFPYTDLRRHRMGALLADDRDEVLPSGGSVDADVWLTRSLWGLADTAPYLHDGRAPTVHDAIVLHGGEASEARFAYLDLDEEDQRALQVFLLSLTRAPTMLVE